MGPSPWDACESSPRTVERFVVSTLFRSGVAAANRSPSSLLDPAWAKVEPAVRYGPASELPSGVAMEICSAPNRLTGSIVAVAVAGTLKEGSIRTLTRAWFW